MKYHELNLRPGKCLDYKTSYEVYSSKRLYLKEAVLSLTVRFFILLPETKPRLFLSRG